MRCLSCMKLKFHVQFLGEKRGVILLTYPTIAEQPALLSIQNVPTLMRIYGNGFVQSSEDNEV